MNVIFASSLSSAPANVRHKTTSVSISVHQCGVHGTATQLRSLHYCLAGDSEQFSSTPVAEKTICAYLLEISA